MRFADRREAGLALSNAISPCAGALIGVGRSGLAVAAAAAECADLSLDVTVALNIRPAGSRRSLGAVAAGDVAVLDQDAIAELEVPGWALDYLVASAAHLALSEERALRRDLNHGFPTQPALLVDDGLSDRFLVQAAARSLRQRGVDICGVVAPPGGGSATSYALDRRPSEGDVRQLLRAAGRKSEKVPT